MTAPAEYLEGRWGQRYPLEELQRYYAEIVHQRNMTLVIMAICQAPADGTIRGQSYVIAACDSLISGTRRSVLDRNVAKVQKAGNFSKWLIGYANTPEHFLPIRNEMGRYVSPMMRDSQGDVTIEEAMDALEQAYVNRREYVVTKEILRPIGYKSIESFLERGSNELLPKVYKNIARELREYQLPVSIVAAGFTRLGDAQLLHIQHPGRAVSHTAGSCGAFAIGSGDYHAMFHLDATYTWRMSLDNAVFRILEAKMLADESVRSVGARNPRHGDGLRW